MSRRVSELDRVVRGGIAEHCLRVERDEYEVPTVLWRPAAPDAELRPLVLLGHGGSGNKRSERIVELAHWLVESAGLAAVAIDGPYHGERVQPPLTTREYQNRIAVEGAANVAARMTDDWSATIDAVGELGLAADDALGYIGLSMGTRYGLPLAATLGERLRCAVFGKFGLDSPLLPPELDTDDLALEASGHVGARTLFHVQWDDEVFPRAGQLALFDALGSRDKRLLAFPGRHAETHADAVSTWREFIAAGLT